MSRLYLQNMERKAFYRSSMVRIGGTPQSHLWAHVCVLMTSKPPFTNGPGGDIEVYLILCERETATHWMMQFVEGRRMDTTACLKTAFSRFCQRKRTDGTMLFCPEEQCCVLAAGPVKQDFAWWSNQPFLLQAHLLKAGFLFTDHCDLQAPGCSIWHGPNKRNWERFLHILNFEKCALLPCRRIVYSNICWVSGAICNPVEGAALSLKCLALCVLSGECDEDEFSRVDMTEVIGWYFTISLTQFFDFECFSLCLIAWSFVLWFFILKFEKHTLF